ncbi:UvrB/UvrC motif-containing protein [bacterium]|nr:UvrB/UvrC motif-containing protein [bacterium]
MSKDISKLLNEWEYDSFNHVRRIVGQDGKEKLQVRVELGILQMEMDGRPDGKRPYGAKSLLDYYELLLQKHISQHGDDEGFTLGGEACEDLRQEGLLYYQRYVLFFELGDYERTARDTERNARLFDFVWKYAKDKKDAEALEQYRAYIIRMNVAARALKDVQSRNYDSAMRRVRNAIQKIENLPLTENPTFLFEKNRSLSVLRGMLKDLESRKPPSKIDFLRKELARALNEERFEDAARLRDEINKLEG